jgi:hypothetical protein
MRHVQVATGIINALTSQRSLCTSLQRLHCGCVEFSLGTGLKSRTNSFRSSRGSIAGYVVINSNLDLALRPIFGRSKATVLRRVFTTLKEKGYQTTNQPANQIANRTSSAAQCPIHVSITHRLRPIIKTNLRHPHTPHLP